MSSAPMLPPAERSHITGLILAGGQARRMGGQDKGLLSLRGRPLITYTLAGLAPQVAAIIINANRRLTDYARFHYPIVSDEPPGYLGPLAGLAAGMQAATTPYLVTVPCDSPYLPPDYVPRMIQAAQQQPEIVVAYGEDRMQPVFTLLECRLASSLRNYLSAGDRKMEHWIRSHRHSVADFSDCAKMFININTPEDLCAVERDLQYDDPETTQL